MSGKKIGSFDQFKCPTSNFLSQREDFILNSKKRIRDNFVFRKAKSQSFLPTRLPQTNKKVNEGILINIKETMSTISNIRSNDLLDIPAPSSNQVRNPSSPNHPKKDRTSFVRNLKVTLDEQCNRLSHKFNFDLELMDDVKSFTKHKATLDKDYSQKLLSLVSQYSQKLPGDRDIPEAEERSLLDVWKIILEACHALAEGMGKISDSLTNEVCNIIRSKRKCRDTSYKKGQEQAGQMAAELMASAKELSKSQRNYNEAEKEACEIRQKFSHIEAKQRGGRTSMFETHSHLEKNFSKTKRKVLTTERKTTDSRNEYLMLIEAFNGHANQYQFSYMRQLQKELSDSYFREMRDHMITIGRSCVETFDDLKSQFLNSLTASNKTKAQFEIDSFLSENPVFTASLDQEYEPFSNDPVHSISKEYGSYSVLIKATQNLTLQVVQEQEKIAQKTKATQGLNSVYEAYTKTPEFGTEEAYLEAELNIEMFKREIRQCEIVVLRAESKLSLLANLGIDVDKYRTSALDIARTQTSSSVLTVSRDSKTLNTRSLAALTSSANKDLSKRNSMPDATPCLLVSQPSSLKIASDSNNGFTPVFNHSTSFMDVSSSDDETSEADNGANGASKKMATVLYSFQATTEEDISIFENEMVEIIEEEDNGWCWGVNSKGDEGYFPSSYVQLVARPSTPESITSSTSIPSLHTQGSTASQQSRSLRVRSICAYDAGENDELSFPEGILIQVVSKEDEDWWMGNYNGKVGVFPVGAVQEVEELTSGLSNNTSRESSISEPTV